MYRYIISRILLVFPTLIGAAALVFLLMRLVPGDICLVRLGSGGTSFTQQALASCHAEIGIDRPWILQFLDFLWAWRGSISASRYSLGAALDASWHDRQRRFPQSRSKVDRSHGDIVDRGIGIATRLAHDLGVERRTPWGGSIVVGHHYRFQGLATPDRPIVHPITSRRQSIDAPMTAPWRRSTR